MSLIIVDYGSGNIASVLNMVRRCDASARTSTAAVDVCTASKLILPGVGAFDHGVRQLQTARLFDAIQECATRGSPILGICLGMQLLTKRSEEGALSGLGLIDATCKRFDFANTPALRVPHVGWNLVAAAKPNPLIPDDGVEHRFYFTHSYHVVCSRPEDVLATTDYGYTFAAALGRDHVYGVQFHPEKSHRFGIALIERFVAL